MLQDIIAKTKKYLDDKEQELFPDIAQSYINSGLITQPDLAKIGVPCEIFNALATGKNVPEINAETRHQIVQIGIDRARERVVMDYGISL